MTYDEAMEHLEKIVPPDEMGEWQNVGMVAIKAEAAVAIVKHHKTKLVRVRTY